MLLACFNLLKITVLPRLIYEFTVTPIQITMSIFKEQSKLIFKFMWVNKCTRLVRRTLERKSSERGPALKDTEAFYKGSRIKTMWYWCVTRQTDHWIRRESPEINSDIKTSSIAQRRDL